MDWGSFWALVAVAVVGGLITLAISEGVRWYFRRRGRQAKEAQERYIERTPIRVGGHIVAEELRANAEIAERCEGGSVHVPEETQRLHLLDWRGRKHEMAGLRDEDPELWTDLEGTYAALEQSKRDGGFPPTEASLLELADRLDGAAGD